MAETKNKETKAKKPRKISKKIFKQLAETVAQYEKTTTNTKPV